LPSSKKQLSSCENVNVKSLIIVSIISFSEYEALDLELDQLNSCLDKLENWNDSLQSRMKDMLENMQKTRVERQLQFNGNSSDTDTQRPQDTN